MSRPGRASRLALGALVAAAGGAACGGDGGAGTPRSIVSSPHADHVCGALFDVQWRLGARVRGAVPDALDLQRYPLQADGTFASPAGTTCSDAMAARLTALCAPCQARPEDCEPLVRAAFLAVPASCERCGDGACHGGETAASCAPDCGASCGDHRCDLVESAVTCPTDCATACGDGLCAASETPDACPADCRFTVGDGLCEPGETPSNSPEDCGYATCGDAYCQSYETALRCPEDCCWPRACDATFAPRCEGDLLERCELRGLGGCPEVVRERCPDNAPYCHPGALGAACSTEPP